MKAVILAGGRGSRIEEESVSRPKPLVEIGDHPIIWHIMNIYAAQGIKDFIVCAGYKGHLVKEYFSRLILYHGDMTVDLATNSVVHHDTKPLDWRVTVADTGLQTDTGGRVGRIRRYLDRHMNLLTRSAPRSSTSSSSGLRCSVVPAKMTNNRSASR